VRAELTAHPVPALVRTAVGPGGYRGGMAEESANEPVDAELVPVNEPAPFAGPDPALLGDYTAGGVPTFEFVRDRIEGRAGTAIGAEELAGATPEGAELDKRFAEREQAGKDRLAEIRRSMGL
jgi:hypothetical protein